MKISFRDVLCLMGLAALSSAGCASKEYVRGSQEPGIDAPAMSTGLDKHDIQQMLTENLNNLRTVARHGHVARRAAARRPSPIFPFSNETSEHIESQLQAILSEAETWLVESQHRHGGRAASGRTRSSPRSKARETRSSTRRTSRSTASSSARKYFLTGKVQTSDERTEDVRRVQYFFFMQVIEVETGAIRWQHKAYVTKMREVSDLVAAPGCHLRSSAVALAASALVGCGGHEARTLRCARALDRGQPRQAIARSTRSSASTQRQDLPKKIEGDNALLVLDRGTIQQSLTQFKLSKRDFEAADKAIDMLDLAHNAGDSIGEYVFSGSSGGTSRRRTRSSSSTRST